MDGWMDGMDGCSSPNYNNKCLVVGRGVCCVVQKKCTCSYQKIMCQKRVKNNGKKNTWRQETKKGPKKTKVDITTTKKKLPPHSSFLFPLLKRAS